jgi:hypothetical protein
MMTPEEQIVDLQRQITDNQAKIKDLIDSWQDIRIGLKLLWAFGRVVRAVVCFSWKVAVGVLTLAGIYHAYKHGDISSDATTWLKAVLELE